MHKQKRPTPAVRTSAFLRCSDQSQMGLRMSDISRPSILGA